ncbi:MAG: gluconokinase [Oscillatoriales cyanobacterium SM2_3_0]|nr:gluconokinase [Oscillatoriales cyanobacterium SM2_3_0]
MIVLITGVAGSGKSTIGQLLAESLGWEFFDADDFHSLTNREKMRQNIPLTEGDRRPWLEQLQAEISQWLTQNHNVVLACSALKQSYRQILLQDRPQIKLVYLRGSFELIAARLQHRQHHFMTVELLQSQFEALEEPEQGIIIEIGHSPAAIVQDIQLALKNPEISS